MNSVYSGIYGGVIYYVALISSSSFSINSRKLASSYCLQILRHNFYKPLNLLQYLSIIFAIIKFANRGMPVSRQPLTNYI